MCPAKLSRRRPGRVLADVDVTRQRAWLRQAPLAITLCADIRAWPLHLLMGVAATFIARLLNRHRWVAYLGLAIIVYVSIEMIWRGFWEIEPHVFG
jgi:hypothetical protein